MTRAMTPITLTMPRLAWLAATLTLGGVTTFAQTPDTTFLEALTWTEVRDAIQTGTTTVIIPTAGTEQKGPHMVLGEHRFVVNHAADLIARRLGNALVAPVITQVTEVTAQLSANTGSAGLSV